MLDIAQSFVGCFERAVFHPQCSIVAFQFFERLQAAANGGDLPLQTRAGLQERGDDLEKRCLDLPGRLRSDAEEGEESRGEKNDRDDAAAAHSISDFRIPISDFTVGQSAICNLRSAISSLPPLPIGGCDLAEKLDFV